MTDFFTWIRPPRWLILDHADEPPHGCCAIIEDQQCGLWCGHDGDHTPHQIGDYLPPPLLTPLDLLALRLAEFLKNCPLCSATVETVDVGPSLVFREGHAFDSEMENEWFFWPCGCEGRELLALAPEC